MAPRGRERLPRVLLADDYSDALEVWSAFLRSAGFDVITAESGPLALERTLRFHPDVVLLDLDLPGMTGIDVARRLRASPEAQVIPLIAITGLSGERQHLEAKRAGFGVVLLKPCDPDDLLEQIEMALARAGDARR